jgi:hypothetical protein
MFLKLVRASTNSAKARTGLPSWEHWQFDFLLGSGMLYFVVCRFQHSVNVP